MLWCFNLLRVQGMNTDVDEFARRVRAATERACRAPLIYPLYFGSLDPRPVAHDVDDESMGALGHAAYHGDFVKVLNYPGIAGRGFTTRAQLCRFLDSRDKNFQRFANLFESNRCKYGHCTWLAWNREHYGTQWDLAEETRVTRVRSDLLEYHFQTVEAPPLPWVALAASIFPQLSLHLIDALEAVSL
jgi:hypothetical protein